MIDVRDLPENTGDTVRVTVTWNDGTVEYGCLILRHAPAYYLLFNHRAAHAGYWSPVYKTLEYAKSWMICRTVGDVVTPPSGYFRSIELEGGDGQNAHNGDTP